MHVNAWLTIVLVVFGILVAELARSVGRLLAGLAVGLRPTHVTIGVGSVIGRRSGIGIGWIWRAVPLQIEANWRIDTEPRQLRMRLWLMTLGGPLAYIALIFVVKALGVRLTGDAGTRLPAQTIATMAGVMLLGRLLPIELGTPTQRQPTDGLQLWRTLRAPLQALIDALVPCARFAIFEDMRAGRPADALALCLRGKAMFSAVWTPEMTRLEAGALGRLGRHVEARDLSAANLELALPASARSAALNAWSWFAFCARDERDLRLADARSAEALTLTPKLSWVAGTRGAALLWRGRVQEAIPLLERAHTDAKVPWGRALDAALLAIAHASRGESERARQLVEEARASGDRASLFDEAERAVAAAAASFRVLFSERGGRALLIDPEGIDLLEGIVGRPADRDALLRAARARRRVTLSELTAIEVSRGVRGRARLTVAAGGRSWHLPLATVDLMWARLLVEDVLSPTRPRVAIPKAPREPRDLMSAAIMAVGFAVIVSVMLGFHFFAALDLSQVMLIAVVLIVRPGAPAALAFATIVLLGEGFALTGDALEAPSLVQTLPALGLATAALLAGVTARLRARTKVDGFSLAMGALVLTLGLRVFIAIALAKRGKDWRQAVDVRTVVSVLVAACIVQLAKQRRPTS